MSAGAKYHTLFFYKNIFHKFYKNIFYKNIEAEIC